MKSVTGGRPTSNMVAFSALSASLSAGYGVLFTVVGDFRDEYGISETAVGTLIGIGFLAAFVSQILVAPLADRGHARHVVFAGVGLNVLGLVLLAFGTSLAPLLAGRIVSGLGIGAALPAIRRIVILSDRENLGTNLGRLLGADVFGFALGPAISAVLVGPFGLASPFLVIAVATIASLVIALRQHVAETSEAPKQRFAFDLLRSREFAGAVLLGATAFLMIGTFDALWDLVHEDLDTPTWMANLGITLFAVPLVIFAPIGGRLAERIGPFRVGAVGLFLGAGFMASYGMLPSGSWIFAVAMVHATSDGLTFAAAGIAVATVVDEDRQAGAQGVMGAAQALFAGITAIIIGSLYESSGRFTAYVTGAAGMLVFTVIAMVLAAPYWRHHSPADAADATT